MCSNSFPIYGTTVKYPYSKLDGPTYKYVRLIDQFFSSMYEGIEFKIVPYHEKIDILIFNVNPHKVYNPYNFDPSYVVKIFDGKEYKSTHITEREFFETFYSYIPDIVPYLNFKLIPPNDFNHLISGVCEEFNLKNYYFESEHRKDYYRSQNHYLMTHGFFR